MHRSLALSAIRSGVNNAAPVTAARASPSATVLKRNLVSSVLLDREVYNKKNVADLKSELKQRGLTTSGKRRDLIDRLMSSDGRNARVLPSGESNQPSQSRSASTKSASSSSSSSSSPPSKDNVKPETSEGSVGGVGKATVSHPPDIEPGQVSSNAHDETGAITKNAVLEAPPTAPGVPPERVPHVPVTFEVKIPYEEVDQGRGPVIPLMTGYFHPEKPLFTGFVDYDGPIAHMPKVMTISGEATYPGGGPSHHNADFEEPDISRSGLLSKQTPPSDELSISSAINSLFKTMRDDLGISIDAATEEKAKATASSTANSTTSLLKEARDNLAARVGSMTSGSGSSSASYSTSSSSSGSARPMNDEETRGLYILGGILTAGFLLGGAAKPTKRQVEEVKSEIESKSNEGKKQGPAVLSDSELNALVKKAEGALSI